jgi:hypothetical protein
MKMLLPFALSSLAFAASVHAATPGEITDQVSQERLEAVVAKLVGFGTRHTLSSQTDPKRGIGAALKWTQEEFGRYSRACGNCLMIVTPSDTVTGDRGPARERRSQAGGDHLGPYRQPGDRRDELGRGRSRGQ